MSESLTLYITTITIVLLLLVAYYSYYGGSLGKVEMVLLFYRPGCPWCEVFKPEWEIVENKLGKLKAKKINTKDPISNDIIAKFDVDGVPTIIFVDVFGKSEVYNGARTADAILSKLNLL
jgi:thioredoxin-related protein